VWVGGHDARQASRVGPCRGGLEPGHHFLGNGRFRVTLVVSDNDGGTDSFSRLVLVKQ
jgi:hypothetical protein